MKIIYNRRIKHSLNPKIFSKNLDSKLYDVNVNQNENEYSSAYNQYFSSNKFIDKRIIEKFSNL